MTDSTTCYSVGALLYCPANNESIVNSLITGRFETPFSLALCLEDTIRDDRVSEAETQLISSLRRLKAASMQQKFYMPRIFIRVREPQQIRRLFDAFCDTASLVSGFILPKFSLDNADAYISAILHINKASDHTLFMMPILENPALIDLRSRHQMLYDLKDKLDLVRTYVLNVRVGGNDLNHVFGFRRKSGETIYDILPVAQILTDIMTVFGIDYVVSGPVWEYYSGDGWDSGLSRELSRDLLNGFIGKTVIHPNQIPVVNQSLIVSRPDYDDACSVLNWNSRLTGLVSGSCKQERMNEFKTHHRWAEKILALSAVYGIAD